jgi:hypothetical protein
MFDVACHILQKSSGFRADQVTSSLLISSHQFVCHGEGGKQACGFK